MANGTRSRPGRGPASVAEQRDPVHGDRDQPGERGVLVGCHQPFRPSPGFWNARPAIASPTPTDSPISASATSPRRAGGQPPAVVRGRASCRRPPSPGRSAARRHDQHVTVSAAAVPARPAPRPSRAPRPPRGRRDGGGGDQPGPRRPTGRGVEEWCASSRPAPPHAPVDAGGGHGVIGDPRGPRLRGAGDVVRAVYADIAAAVDHARAVQFRHGPVGREPWHCRRSSAGPVAADRPAPRPRPPPPRARGGRAPGGRGAQGGARARPACRRPRRARVPGAPRPRRAAWVGEPAGPPRAEQRRLHRAPQQRRRGHLGRAGRR